MNYVARALETAFKIINFIANEPVATASNIAKELGLSKRTVQRYLTALEQSGFLRKVSAKGYFTSHRWFLTDKAKKFGA